MQGTTQPIDRQTLLEKANKLIREHEDTLAGIEATDVVQRNGVLVFSGEFYLDEQGLPTAKSTAVFNMFKYLAHELSDKYHWRINTSARPDENARPKPRVVWITSAVFARAATSAAGVYQRFPRRYR